MECVQHIAFNHPEFLTLALFHKSSVKSDVKLSMAKALVQQYPQLNNTEGDGYVSISGCFLHFVSFFQRGAVIWQNK